MNGSVQYSIGILLLFIGIVFVNCVKEKAKVETEKTAKDEKKEIVTEKKDTKETKETKTQKIKAEGKAAEDVTTTTAAPTEYKTPSPFAEQERYEALKKKCARDCQYCAMAGNSCDKCIGECNVQPVCHGCCELCELEANPSPLACIICDQCKDRGFEYIPTYTGFGEVPPLTDDDWDEEREDREITKEERKRRQEEDSLILEKPSMFAHYDNPNREQMAVSVESVVQEGTDDENEAGVQILDEYDLDELDEGLTARSLIPDYEDFSKDEL